jgi:patatin-like phospholipase/acyl hydrolase
VVLANQNEEQYYNILSIDGGGLRGIIPATVLYNIEKYAWNYSVSQNYTFPKYPGREG